MKRLLYLSLFVGWLGVIVYLSQQSVSDSRTLSKGVSDFLKGWIQLIAPDSNLDSIHYHSNIRKLAHCLLYFVLAFIIASFISQFRFTRTSFKTFLFTLIICMIFAIADETLQLFSVGRGVEFEDVVLDTIGAIVGVVVYLAFKKGSKSYKNKDRVNFKVISDLWEGNIEVKNKLLQMYRAVKINRTFILKQRKSFVPTKLTDKIQLARQGFLGESKTIYNLSTNGMKYYLSDIQRLKTRYINAPYSFILDEKIVFEAMYKRQLKIPESFALIKKGKLIPLQQENKMENIRDLISYLDAHEKCVIKPVRNGGGYGIHILSKISDDYYINGKLVTLIEVSEKVEALNDYFVSEFIIQGKFGTSLYPGTTNTIRIVTMIDPATNKAFIPIAVQRIGNKDSSPTDNWTQGGLSAEINLETGMLGQGVTYPKDGVLKYHDHHPETQSRISETVIPHWDMIKEEILKAADLYPYISYIGWDVVTTDEGYMVLEGNNFTDVNLLQVHKPLLKDERVIAFYKTHGILK